MSAAIVQSSPDVEACARETTSTRDFDLLAASLRDRLIAYLRSRFGDELDPEESADLALIRAWKSFRKFDPLKGSFSAWLFRIGANVCYRRWRRGLAEPEKSLDDPGFKAESISSNSPDPAKAYARKSLRQAVRSAIAGLPKPERQAVVLVFVHELSQVEAARRLGWDVDRVFYRLHRAEVLLHRRLSRCRCLR